MDFLRCTPSTKFYNLLSKDSLTFLDPWLTGLRGDLLLGHRLESSRRILASGKRSPNMPEPPPTSPVRHVSL